MTTPTNDISNFFALYGGALQQQRAQQTATDGGQDAGGSATTTAGAANDFLSFLQSFRNLGASADISSGDGNDDVTAAAKTVTVDAGAGDDTVTAAGYDVAVNGGDGNDTINAFGYKVAVKGGAGDDVIHAASYVPKHGPIPLGQISGGDGNDEIDLQGLTGYVNGGAGNDVIHASDSSVIEAYGGTGDDTIIAEKGGSNLFGGAGSDTIVSRGNLFHGNVFGGAGNDDVTISGHAVEAYGGTGDDNLTLDNAVSIIGYQDTEDGFVPKTEFRSIAEGGLGDDSLTFTNGSFGNIQYNAGDGNDTVTGADERSVLKLGKGLAFENTTFATSGNDLTVSFQDGGSITFKDYQTKGLPRIQFDDGRQLDASTTIAYAGGDPNAYAANDLA